MEQTELQLQRTPGELPTLKLNPEVNSIFDFTYNDIEILNYNPQPHIAAPVAV